MKNRKISEGISKIQETAADLAEITRREQTLTQTCDEEYSKDLTDYSMMYIEKALVSTSDDVVRKVTTDLVSEKYVLSKVHTKYTKIETEQDRLEELVPRAIYELKEAILQCRLKDVRNRIQDAANNHEEQRRLMAELMKLQQLKNEFARFLGERIIAPRK